MEMTSVSTRKKNLTAGEIQKAFADVAGERFPIIVSPSQLAQLLGLSIKTIYDWIAHGRLDGAVRKRGKHVLIWRDRVLEILFNGPDWKA